MVKTKIREAKSKEITKIVPLWKKLMAHHNDLAKKTKMKWYYELLPDSAEKWEKWVRKELKSKNGMLLIAEDNGRVVGYSLNILKKNIPIFTIKKLGHFSDLYIEPEYRSKGMGREFMKIAIEWFKKKKIKFVSIAAHALNPNAIRIYRKFGFSDFHVEMRMKL